MNVKSCITKLNANIDNSLLTDQVDISNEKISTSAKTSSFVFK